MISKNRVIRASFIHGIWAAALAASTLLAATPALEQARKLYSAADFDASLKLLQSLPAKDGAAYELIGRNYYMMGDYKKATDYLEKAQAAEPQSSDHALWLGRAWGRRAETSSPFTAPGHASKARQNFERAVQLDPRNMEALNDLFQYYLEAPGFLGGGFDKAVQIAARISSIDPVEGYYAQAQLAEKRKQYGSAEQNLRRAAELAPQQVGRVLDLARFLAKQGRFQESEQSFQRAEKIAPNSPKVMFARADTYIRHGRNLDTARELLKRYLSARLTADDPPRYEAQKLLKQVSGT
jgi:tetratricopeptide (TPR) repeat protein